MSSCCLQCATGFQKGASLRVGLGFRESGDDILKTVDKIGLFVSYFLMEVFFFLMRFPFCIREIFT